MFWWFSAQNSVAYDRTLPRLTPLWVVGSRLIRGWSAIVAAPDQHADVKIDTYFSDKPKLRRVETQHAQAGRGFASGIRGTEVSHAFWWFSIARENCLQLPCMEDLPMMVVFHYIYSLVNVYMTMENNPFQWVNQLFQWPCSITFCMSLPEDKSHIILLFTIVKPLNHHWKSPFKVVKSPYNSFLYVYQGPSLQMYANLCHGLILISCRPTLWHYPVLCPKATWEKQGKQGGGHVWNILLVGGLEPEFYDFPYIGNSNPNWRTHIFQRGRYTTNQFLLVLNVGNFREWSTGQLSIITRATPIPIHSLLSTRKYFIHITYSNIRRWQWKLNN